MATFPRSDSCSQPWFPPATFQLRLRSLKSVIVCSPLPPKVVSGSFHLTFHETVMSPPFWTSADLKWQQKDDRLEWPDIDLRSSSANLSLTSLVVRLWFAPDGPATPNDPMVVTVWGVSFSGLACLGTHPPHIVPEMKENALMFNISGSYFTAPHSPVNKHLHFKQLHSISSYDVSLLLRLHRTQRALKQQTNTNTTLKKGLLNKGMDETYKEIPIPTATPSLRQQIFSKISKSPATRQKELSLKSKVEHLKIRNELLKKEKSRIEKDIQEMEDRRSVLSNRIEETTSRLLNSFHSLSKEKALLVKWMEKFSENKTTKEKMAGSLKNRRFKLISDFSEIFYISEPDGRCPTLRYVSLPGTAELKDLSKNETDLTVVFGWIAHLVLHISTVLGIQLRYPIRVSGATCSIYDHLREMPEKELIEFPLFVKGADWIRFEYGIYLLNKNIAQIRWHCGLVTTDLRPTLGNLHDLLRLGKGFTDEEDDAMSTYSVNSLTDPTRIEVSAKIPGKTNSGTSSISSSTANSCASTPPGKKSLEGSRKNSCPNVVVNGGPVLAIAATSSSLPSVSAASSGIPVMPSASSSSSMNGSPKVICLVGPAMKNGEERKGKDCLDAGESLDDVEKSANDQPNNFWDNVTDRTMALSNPTSFQRRRNKV